MKLTHWISELFEGLNPSKISAILTQFAVYMLLRTLVSIYIMLTNITSLWLSVFFNAVFIGVQLLGIGFIIKFKIYEVPIVWF